MATVYGNTANFLLKGVEPDLTLNINPDTTNSNFSSNRGPSLNAYGSNIVTNNADSIVYGNMISLAVSNKAGNLWLSINNASQPTAISSKVFMNNELFTSCLSSGNGNDILYGNGDSINSVITGSSNTYNIINAHMLPPSTPDQFNITITDATTTNTNARGNTLSSGDGNDTLYGNTASLNVLILPSSESSNIIADTGTTSIYGSPLNMSYYYGNTLSSGIGNSKLFGNGNSLTISETGYTTTDAIQFTNGTADSTKGYVYLEHDTYNQQSFNGNTLTSANIAGNTGELYGNFNVYNIALTGSNMHETLITSTAQDTMRTSVLTANIQSFGGNTITSGAGDDIIYGNVNNSILSITGGNFVAQIFNPAGTIDVLDDTVSVSYFGANVINAGGGNDIIYGNMNNCLVSIAGSNIGLSISGAGSTMVKEFTMGIMNFSANSITAGAGNDIAYGNLNSLVVTVNGGSLSNTSAGGANYSLSISDYCSMNFGANILHATSGNDTLYGNMQSLNLLSTSSTPSTFVFGNNQLFADSGQCTLVASVASYSMSTNVTAYSSGSNVIIKDAMGNSITWGNTTLSGGENSDTFVFALANTANNKVVMQGNSIITNFGNDATHFDTIQFNQYAASGSLSSHTSIVHSGADTTIQFDGGGSIKLLGVNINSLDDIHHT